MLVRHAAQGPQRVLEVLGQRRETLATQHDGRMLPAAVGQNEVKEAVRQRLTGDRHAECAGVGEVRQGHAAGLWCLPEDHVLLRSVQGAPVAHAALGRPAHPIIGEAGRRFG